MEFVRDHELEFVDTLLLSGSRKRFSRGDLIYSETESPKGLHYIESGLVGLTKMSASGNESLLRIFRAEQFFGHRTLFSNEKYHATAKCLENTDLVFLEKKLVFEVFDKNPSSYFFLARALAKELRRAEDRSVLISEGHIIERVAYALILFKKLHPEHIWTRTEIANYCASRTPTVIKAMGELEKKGAIRQNRRYIEILDESILIDVVEDLQ